MNIYNFDKCQIVFKKGYENAYFITSFSPLEISKFFIFVKLINEKWLFCFICLSALIASKIGAFVQRFVGHLYFVGM